jgi:hypothetical protein
MKSRVEINSIKKVIDFNSNNDNHKLVKHELFIRTNKKKKNKFTNDLFSIATFRIPITLDCWSHMLGTFFSFVILHAGNYLPLNVYTAQCQYNMHNQTAQHRKRMFLLYL